MPRRNRTTPVIVIDEFVSPDEPKEEIRVVKPYLRDNVWNMMKQTNQKIECPVCLDEIDCKNCFCLLTCGHHLHLHELLRCKSCPVCRS